MVQDSVKEAGVWAVWGWAGRTAVTTPLGLVSVNKTVHLAWQHPLSTLISGRLVHQQPQPFLGAVAALGPPSPSPRNRPNGGRPYSSRMLFRAPALEQRSLGSGFRGVESQNMKSPADCGP